MHLPIVLCYSTKRHCLPTNYQNIGVNSLNATCVQRFVHVSNEVIDLHKHIVMYGPKLFFTQKRMFTQILLCLFSAHHQTLSPPHQVSGVGLSWLVRFANST